jgi:hypothetical protein
MREFRSSGSVRGVLSNGHPYRGFANLVLIQLRSKAYLLLSSG